MADDILDEMDEAFDEDMADILDDSDDDALGDDLDDDLDDLEDSLDEAAGDEPGSAAAPEDGGSKEGESKFAGLIASARELPKKLFGSAKAIIILSVSIVLLILLVLLLWLFVFRGGPEESLQPAPVQAQEEAADQLAAEEEIVFEDIVELEPFERISLKTSSTMGLLSLTLSLELTDARYRKQVYAVEDRIRKIVESQVKNTTWLSLRSPEGKLLLKYELIKRINDIFPKTTVRNVYFTTFIMQ